ncbi:hypothetical protein [Halomonas aestuarii]|uniref:hypothetical protein n=1 Tax=Halomonas aestuarii TaxID=1897729 RepID=UPI000F771867|nr:hypothetical protein [Halomonas aestuarii]
MRSFEYYMNQWLFFEAIGAVIGLVIVIFFMWCFYIYVTSRREWFEEDVKIRRAEVSYNLARAEQIRLESLALKDRLEKSGINTKQSFM